ncbi:hypothetical protein PM082_012349 [Marasmius tenuissimus]|nr:hypothetical protein PM082_012349 [Marasmius tenuissimus]
MDQLPTEILCTIFSIAILQDAMSANIRTEAILSEGRKWPCIKDFNHGPWSISRVCRKWNVISTSFPSLWNQFLLSATGLATGTRLGSIEALRKWLAYSGTTGLSFLIQTDGICNIDGDSELFKILVEQAERWERVEVINSSYAFWYLLHHYGTKGRLRSLKSVTFLSEGQSQSYIHDGFQNSFDSSYYSVFENAPILQTLVNHDFFTLSDIPVPWAQLTMYEGSHRVGYHDHFIVLRYALNLESCILEIGYDPIHGALDQDPSTITPISLPKLRTLRITMLVSDSVEISSFIRSMSMPCLQSLSIEIEDVLFPPYGSLASVLHSSSAPLQVLELSEDATKGDDLIDLLRASASALQLSISIAGAKRFGMSRNTIVGSLGHAPEQENLLPALDTLELKLPSPSDIRDVDFGSLATVIRSRRRHQTGTIRNLWLSFGKEGLDYSRWVRDIQPNMPPPILEVLQEEGLKIVIRECCGLNE